MALTTVGCWAQIVPKRPGGWVDQIARMWPVDGVVGENGGLWYWLDSNTGKLERRFVQDADVDVEIEQTDRTRRCDSTRSPRMCSCERSTVS